MPLPAQDPHTSVTPPTQDPPDLELQDSTGKRPPSPPAQDPKLQDNTELRQPSPPTQDLDLQDTMGKRMPSPLDQDTHSHPSIKQLELLPITDRETPQPLPSTQQLVYVTTKDSVCSGFYVSG
jgi:hypothetical protein